MVQDIPVLWFDNEANHQLDLGPIRTKRRQKHVTFGVLSLVCLLLGMLAVYLHHIGKNESISYLFKPDVSLSFALHMYGGYAMLILAVAQGSSGFMMRGSRLGWFKYHRSLGTWLPMIGLMMVGTTVLFWKRYEGLLVRLVMAGLLVGLLVDKIRRSKRDGGSVTCYDVVMQ